MLLYHDKTIISGSSSAISNSCWKQWNGKGMYTIFVPCKVGNCTVLEQSSSKWELLYWAPVYILVVCYLVLSDYEYELAKLLRPISNVTAEFTCITISVWLQMCSIKHQEMSPVCHRSKWSYSCGPPRAWWGEWDGAGWWASWIWRQDFQHLGHQFHQLYKPHIQSCSQSMEFKQCCAQTGQSILVAFVLCHISCFYALSFM